MNAKVEVSSRVLKRATACRLSKRQLEILLLCADDMPRKAIADKLGISLARVSYHVTMIHLKTGVHSTAAAVAFLYR